MKKILSLLPVLLLNLALVSAEPVRVKNVTFQGNNFISTEKLLLLIKSRSGADYSEEILREDVKRLTETGYFAEVAYHVQPVADGVDVVFQVKENPIIKEIYITGNRAVKTSTLRKKLGVEKGTL
ncbi:MAG TPA: POTRA domain-containing protein, partial [bacterium]|nr:POTRA domain-containing protein [bacterium]